MNTSNIGVNRLRLTWYCLYDVSLLSQNWGISIVSWKHYIYRLSRGRYVCFHWAAFSGFWLVGTVRSLVLQEPAFFFKPSDSWRAFVSSNTCNGSHLYKSLQHFQFSWFYSISISPKLHIYIYIYIQLTLAVLSDEQMSGPDDDVPY